MISAGIASKVLRGSGNPFGRFLRTKFRGRARFLRWVAGLASRLISGAVVTVAKQWALRSRSMAPPGRRCWMSPYIGNSLQDCAPVADRTFDIVYACEVVEHVPDPAAFVALLARWVAEDGVLVMTTPSASGVTRENQSTALLAALAPGFHGFLLSPRALGDIAREAGFSHVDVREFGERQMLWASNRPLILTRIRTNCGQPTSSTQHSASRSTRIQGRSGKVSRTDTCAILPIPVVSPRQRPWRRGSSRSWKNDTDRWWPIYRLQRSALQRARH